MDPTPPFYDKPAAIANDGALKGKMTSLMYSFFMGR